MDLVTFLENVKHPAALRDIYSSQYTVAAVFRVLPPVAKQYVLRLLLLDEALPAAVVSSWASPEAPSKHEAAMEQLLRLALLDTCTTKLGEVSYLLTPMFRSRLRQSMCQRLTPSIVKLPEEIRLSVPSQEDVDKYARGQWESMLLYLGGSSDAPPVQPHQLAGASSLDVAQLMLSSGLMVKDEHTRLPAISNRGFNFMLSDTYRQLWMLLRQYIADAQQQSGGALASVISFLLQLGFQGAQHLPVCYSQLAMLEQHVAAHMAQLGLLVPFSAAGAMWLLPSRLATIMAGGASGTASAGDDGFIIVESNFRVYAYTTSAVQISVLRLFVRCDVLLPNLFVGTIKRASAMDALKSGIGAEQIVSYLSQHAHPHVMGRKPVVPDVVSDQIELWQQELDRLKVERCTSYFSFETEELYQHAVTAAQQRGAALFSSNQKRTLVVGFQHHEAMRQELRALKAQLGM